MEKSHLHVSFDDGFTSTSDGKPGVSEKKKSILASANNRIIENKSLLLDDSLNSGIHPLKNDYTPVQSKLPIPQTTVPTTEKTSSTTSPPQTGNDIKSNIPVLRSNDNPPRTVNVKTTSSDTNLPITATEVPVEIALKGFIGQHKQSYDVNVKVPRFNPNSDNKDLKGDNKEDQSEGTAGTANEEKQIYSPPTEVIIEKNQLKTKSDELIPMEELQESPFNRRRHSPKHSKTKDKSVKIDTSIKGTEGTDIIEPPKGPGTSESNAQFSKDLNEGITTGINQTSESDELIRKDQEKAKEDVKSKLLLKSTYEIEDKDQKTNKAEEDKTEKRSIPTHKSDKTGPETKRLATERNETNKTIQGTKKDVSNTDKHKGDEPAKKNILETRKDKGDTDSLKALKRTTELKNDKNKTERNKSEFNNVIVSTRAATPKPHSKEPKGKTTEEKNSKEKLSVPPTPNHVQNTDKSAAQPTSAPGTPRKERLNRDKIKTIVKSSRDASPARSPKRSPAKQDPRKVKPSSDFKVEKLETTLKIENETDPVTTRDIKVQSTEEKKVTKTEDEEAKETADTILNELGDKPKSILARVAMKKIAARATKPGQAQQNGDVKHVSVNDSLNQSKSSGMFALSVPAKGKKDSEDKDDKTSLGSRRDSSKYSIDTASRKSIDIRIQNQVMLGNKPVEEKPKSPLTNTDSWTRSAIPHLPMSVAVLCLLLNILIPGSGTMLSGVAILCCGRPRVNSKDDHVIVTICVNVWVGFAQLFTITFLLVGWFWSLAWGIRMIILAVEYRREQQLQREKQLQTMALSAFGSASHMRSLFP